MEELIPYILQFGKLNQEQIDLISKKAKALDLGKDAYFSEAGKIARQFGFLMKGVIRVCSIDDEGKELTKYFIEEESILTDLNSFDNKAPATVYLQAITECKIIAFSKQDWEELKNAIPELDNIVNKIISKLMFQKVRRLSALVSEDGSTRYLNFLELYPNLVNRIPLSYIASYLGITQSSLSRIRKTIL